MRLQFLDTQDDSILIKKLILSRKGRFTVRQISNEFKKLSSNSFHFRKIRYIIDFLIENGKIKQIVTGKPNVYRADGESEELSQEEIGQILGGN